MDQMMVTARLAFGMATALSVCRIVYAANPLTLFEEHYFPEQHRALRARLIEAGGVPAGEEGELKVKVLVSRGWRRDGDRRSLE